jgi:hypothetical protein
MLTNTSWRLDADSGLFAARQRRVSPGLDLTMQFRIQFLDRSARVIRELHADARNAASAIELVRDIDWPPRAVTLRVLDVDAGDVHSKVKGDTPS